MQESSQLTTRGGGLDLDPERIIFISHSHRRTKAAMATARALGDSEFSYLNS